MHRSAIAALVLLCGASTALAENTTTTTTSAEELLKALKDAGVDLSTLTTVNDDGTVTVKIPGAPEEADKAKEEVDAAVSEAAAAAAEQEEPSVKWDHKLTLAFGVSDGNTERANVTALYGFTRETDSTKLAFQTAYFYSEDSGNESENRFFAGLTNDWYFKNSRWLIFADARYDYDEFQSWRHRFAAHVGPGYKLIDKEDMHLTLRAGIGTVKEWLSDNDNWRPEALAGFDYDWQITKAQSLVANFRYYPDLDDFGEYRVTLFTGWQMQIDKADGLALTLGLLDEYQSNVDPGRDHNDIKIYGGLTFDF